MKVAYFVSANLQSKGGFGMDGRLIFLIILFFLFLPIVQADVSITPTSFTYQAYSNQVGILGQITLTSTENTTLIFNNSIIGVPQLIFIPNFTTAEPNSTQTILVNYFVPSNTASGIYDYIIMINDTIENIVSNISVALSVSDNIPPVITNLNITPTVNITQQEHISTTITDNVNVSYATVNIVQNTIGQIFNMTQNGDVFTYDYYPATINNYSVIVTAYDTSNNQATANGNFTAVPFNPIAVYSVDFGKIKIGTAQSKTIATLLANTTLAFNLRSIVYNENVTGNFTVNIILPDGRNYVIAPGMTIYNFSSVLQGNISMSLGGNTIGYFTGIYAFYSPNETDGQFFGGISNYSLQPAYYFTWQDSPAQCVSFDGGTEESSKYTCTINFPISTDITDLTLPMSPSYLQQVDIPSCYICKNDIGQAILWKNIAFGVAAVSIIGTVIILFYMEVYSMRDE